MIKKKVFPALFIVIIVSTFYLNQGCKIEIFEPTPTPTPTLTPTPTSTLTPTPTPTLTPTLTPTPNTAILSYFKDAKKIIDKFKIIITCETKIFDNIKGKREFLATTFSDPEGYNLYTQFVDELGKQEKLINEFKKNHPKDCIPDFTLFIEGELLYFKDAERMVYASNVESYVALDVYKRRSDVYEEVNNDEPFKAMGLSKAFCILCDSGEKCDNEVSKLFRQGITTCNMGKYFYK